MTVALLASTTLVTEARHNLAHAEGVEVFPLIIGFFTWWWRDAAPLTALLLSGDGNVAKSLSNGVEAANGSIVPSGGSLSKSRPDAANGSRKLAVDVSRRGGSTICTVLCQQIRGTATDLR